MTRKLLMSSEKVFEIKQAGDIYKKTLQELREKLMRKKYVGKGIKKSAKAILDFVDKMPATFILEEVIDIDYDERLPMVADFLMESLFSAMISLEDLDRLKLAKLFLDCIRVAVE